jgi:hypothetical protein
MSTAAELRSIRKGLDKLRAEVRALLQAQAPASGAVKRTIAAKLMGIGRTKLDNLIASGDVRTAVDTRLVPMSEVRRYTAPKLPRRKPRRHDRLVDVRDEMRAFRDGLEGEGA